MKSKKAKTNGGVPPQSRRRLYPFGDMHKGEKRRLTGDPHKIASAAHGFGKRNGMTFSTRKAGGCVWVYRTA